MALPFAHATAGYLVYEGARPAGPHRPGILAAAVVLAIAPDLDFVPGLVVGQPSAFHRGVTHTVFAAGVVGALAWGAVRWWRGDAGLAARAGLWAAAAWASHLVVDFITHDDLPPRGARLLWPFSNAHYLAPYPVLAEITLDRSTRATFLSSLVSGQAVAICAREMAFLLATVGVIHAIRAVRAGATDVRGVAEGS